MANRKISDLTALTTPASGDYLPIVDISEAAAADKNKRITVEELMRGVPSGTAGAPGIAFESDPNTGIYSPGADQLALSTDGTERMKITSDGYVRLASGTGGIQFNGDNAAANALNDYEEGTFTLAYGASGDAAGASIGINGIGAINNCRYTKIGRTVTMTGSVSFANGDGTTWTPGDWVQLSGLPFTLLTAARSSGSGFMTSNPATGAMGTFLISGPTSTNLYIECVTGQNSHSTSNPVEFSITGMVL